MTKEQAAWEIYGCVTDVCLPVNPPIDPRPNGKGNSFQVHLDGKWFTVTVTEWVANETRNKSIDGIATQNA